MRTFVSQRKVCLDCRRRTCVQPIVGVTSSGCSREFADFVISGGLGLTGGIADLGSLFDCLNGIHQGLADDDILDRYAEIRRKIYFDVIDPLSRENFRRLWAQDPDKAKDNDEFFKVLTKAEKDQELAKGLTSVCAL